MVFSSSMYVKLTAPIQKKYLWWIFFSRNLRNLVGMIHRIVFFFSLGWLSVRISQSDFVVIIKYCIKYFYVLWLKNALCIIFSGVPEKGKIFFKRHKFDINYSWIIKYTIATSLIQCHCFTCELKIGTSKGVLEYFYFFHKQSSKEKT